MPIIQAFADHPSRPYVRVQINWSDVPAAQYAGVSRVDVETGECTPLRPYICYDGWELLLSCGSGTFWDTEAPFDRPFYYVTTSSEAPCIPLPLAESTAVYDDFARVLADTWGSSSTGQLYTELAGADTQYDVNGVAGTINPSAAGVNTYALLDAGTPNYTARVNLTSQAVPVGGEIGAYGLNLKWVDDNNYIRVGINATLADVVGVFITQVVGGVTATQFTASTMTAAQLITVEAQVVGSQLQVRAWPTGLFPPPYQLTTTVSPTLLASTMVGAHARREVGNTVPAAFAFDELIVNECPDCEPPTATSEVFTLESDGQFWLKDPVRPCDDQPVPLCGPGAPVTPDCGGEGSIAFVEVGAEIYADNSYRLRPMNRHQRLAITRPRADVTTSLVLETSTFTARDQVLGLVAPGSPLLFQGPSEYGVPDRYMAIGAVAVERPLSDHRIQFRKVTLPYEAVARPAGPSQGICGARVADICELYPTWADLAATGMSWNDLVQGAASPVSANPDRRTWDDVNAEFADWDAVNTDGRTWTRLVEGS